MAKLPLQGLIPPLSARTFSEALRTAVWYRTAAVAALLVLIVVVHRVRDMILKSDTYPASPLWIDASMLVLVTYELVVLAIVSRRKTDAEPLPTSGAVVNAVIECSFPTLLILMLAGSEMISIEEAALSPAVGLYAVFILFSVLQLKPVVGIVCGLVSAVGYSGVIWLGVEPHQERTGVALAPPASSSFLAPLLFITGGAAAFVSNRIRAFVRIAVAEADKRSRADRDLRAASLIQRNLMPKSPPDLPGYEVYGWNRPADETGGDYYDWIRLDDGRVAVSIADVTGHGLGPAMVTCFCRAYARSALRVEDRVARAMQRINNELEADLTEGKFVTFAAAVISPDDPGVVTLSAGHGPFFLYRAARDGRAPGVETFHADGLPLGITASSDELAPVRHQLDPGDTIVLVTDGFFEWASPGGDLWGTERLRDAIARHGSRTPDDLIQTVLRELEDHARGTPQTDDLTAVVIRRAPN